MNIRTIAAFRRLSRNTLFAALLGTTAFQSEARPVLPLLFGSPEVSASTEPADTRLWRYVPLGPRGRYIPVEGSEAREPAPYREVERWVGPRGTVPIHRDD